MKLNLNQITIAVKDPDGNQLVLYYAGKNRKDPPWKIK